MLARDAHEDKQSNAGYCNWELEIWGFEAFKEEVHFHLDQGLGSRSKLLPKQIFNL
jgi:hypothetical protein